MIPDIVLNEGDVKIEWVYEKNVIVGFIFTHPNYETGEECGGYIPFGKDDWKIRKFQPLDIVPSINCNECSSHGFIRDGKWDEYGPIKEEDLQPSLIQRMLGWGY